MLIQVLIMLALANPVHAQTVKSVLSDASVHSDSGIVGRSYAEIQFELQSLEKAYPDFATYFIYGSTIKGRALSGIKIQRKVVTAPAGASAIYIGGTIHGNEFLNIEDRVPRWILETGLKDPIIQNYLNRGGIFYIVPILNPDGYEADVRENEHDVDLNRDYTVQAAGVAGFKEPETRQWASFLENDLLVTQRQLKFALDYHCCIGALLYPWSFRTQLKLPADVQARYNYVGQLMFAQLGTGYKFGQTPAILGYSAPGTSKDYYHERFGALGFTFEGKHGTENKNFDKHMRFLVSVIKGLTL